MVYSIHGIGCAISFMACILNQIFQREQFAFVLGYKSDTDFAVYNHDDMNELLNLKWLHETKFEVLTIYFINAFHDFLRKET